jgi:hypothetical protein
MATAHVTFNSDDTVTIRVGRHVEHIDASTKTKVELFDAIKWAAISKGARISDVKLTELIFNRHG